MNLYGYVHNDPVNFIDPTGLCTGSRIKNEDGTCRSGGFTTGIQGNAGAYAQKGWTTKNFLKHYMTGGGNAVDIGKVGLGAEFENAPSVKSCYRCLH